MSTVKADRRDRREVETAARSPGRPGADTVFQGVLAAIARQRLPPGTKLQEENLAQIFDVSRAQVRSALARLKQRGLVEMEPNRTAAIAAPSPEEVRGIFALRRWIEPEIAAEVAGTLTRRDEALLRDHLDGEQIARDAGDRIEAVRLSGLFHTAIAGLSANALAAAYIAELVDRSFLAIYLYQRPGTAMCVNDEHAGLMRAMAGKDPDASRALMRDHLAHIVSRLNLEQSEETVLDLSLAFRGLF